MLTLLVVGVMDNARDDIQGNGAIQLNFAERTSQVRSAVAGLHVLLCASNRGGKGLTGAFAASGAACFRAVALQAK